MFRRQKNLESDSCESTGAINQLSTSGTGT
jgi:hypothetical protein